MMPMRGCRITGLACIVALSACSYAPMTYMRTYGPAADPVTSLGWGLTIICSLVVALIGVLVLIATLRARVARGLLSTIPIAHPGGGLRWIYIGTGLSTLVLFALVVWTMFTLAAVASAPERPAFTIEIRAHQWWWEARYIDDASDRTFLTANELHIPIGKPVQLRLIGDDVIHSFWIPALAGKTDVIPGQTNSAWLEATQGGTFRRATCAHGRIRDRRIRSGFRLVVDPAAGGRPRTHLETACARRIDFPGALRSLSYGSRHRGGGHCGTRPDSPHEPAHPWRRNRTQRSGVPRALDCQRAGGQARMPHARARSVTRGSCRGDVLRSDAALKESSIEQL